MAKYEVECTDQISEDCEGTFRVQLYGPHDRREWKLQNYDWSCDACKEAKHEEKNAIAAERNAERGLPDLEGSEKQIGWAETIRDEKMGDLQELEEQAKEREPEEEDERIMLGLLLEEIEVVRTETDAGWWIDHRRRSIQRIISRRARDRFENGERPREDLESFVDERLGGDPAPADLMAARDEWTEKTGASPDEALRKIHKAMNADA